MDTSPTDLLLASPLGRQLLASYVGWGPGESLGDALFERLGLGPVPGRGVMTAAGARMQRWQDVPAGLAGRLIGAAVGWRSWREQLAGIGGSALLADLAGDSSSFGFMGGDEELWGLTAQDTGKLQPVADDPPPADLGQVQVGLAEHDRLRQCSVGNAVIPVMESPALFLLGRDQEHNQYPHERSDEDS